MSRVYVPQRVMRWTSPSDHTLVPVHDLAPAERYGELVFLVPNGPVMVAATPMMRVIREKMRGFTDDDYVVALGDPAAIAAAVMVAGKYNHGRVRLLRWDRKMGDYMVLQLDINERAGDENNRTRAA